MALTVASHKSGKQITKIVDSSKHRSCGNKSSKKPFIPRMSCHNSDTVGLSSRDDSVLDVVDVGEKKLAIEIDSIEKQSQSHLKLLQKEEKALEELRRDLRKHTVLDRYPKPNEKLNLPPICTSDHQVDLQRKSLSASNSPATQKRYMHKEGYPLDKRKASWKGDDSIKSRSTDDSASARRGSFKNAGRDVKSMPSGLNRHRNLHKNLSVGTPTPVITVEQVTEDGVCNTRQQKRTVPMWELGLIPTNRTQVPDESKSGAKYQKSINKSSQKAALDPRFQHLESALIPCGRKPLIMPRPPTPNSFLSANDRRGLQNDIRVTRSAPSSPRGHRKHFEGDGFHLMPILPPSGQQGAVMPRPPTPNRLLSTNDESELPDDIRMTRSAPSSPLGQRNYFRGDGIHLLPAPLPSGQQSATMPRSPTPNRLLNANHEKELQDDIRMTRSAPSSPLGQRNYFVGDGLHLMPITPPPSASGHRSAPVSPLRRPKIVIGQHLDDTLSQRRKEDNKQRHEDESNLFDLTRLSPDPIIAMSPPP